MPSLATNSDNLLRIYVRTAAGTLVDPATISLRWKLGPNGGWTTVEEASITHVSTGIYSYTVNPEDDGRFAGFTVLLTYEWIMTDPTYVERGKVALSSTEFVS